MQPLSTMLHNPRNLAYLAGGAGTLLALGGWLLFRRRPTAEQLEARRRERLAAMGRITDGSLIDARPGFQQPQTVIYSYRIAGVAYECSQDISAVPGHVNVPALDLPIQVRYDRDNPGDSIVLAESWNGLWSVTNNPAQAQNQ